MARCGSGRYRARTRRGIRGGLRYGTVANEPVGSPLTSVIPEQPGILPAVAASGASAEMKQFMKSFATSFEQARSQSYRDACISEFYALEQGDMSVARYDQRFNELARYAPFIVQDEEQKKMKFLKGFRPLFMRFLISSGVSTYREVLSKFLALEQSDVEDRKSKDLRSQQRHDQRPDKGKAVQTQYDRMSSKRQRFDASDTVSGSRGISAATSSADPTVSAETVPGSSGQTVLYVRFLLCSFGGMVVIRRKRWRCGLGNPRWVGGDVCLMCLWLGVVPGVNDSWWIRQGLWLQAADTCTKMSIIKGTLPAYIVWEIWKARCIVRFEKGHLSALGIIKKINKPLQESMPKLKITRNSNFSDLISLQVLQLVKQSVHSKRPVLVRWTYPPLGYFKLNNDGSTLTSRMSGAGGIIRNNLGEHQLGYNIVLGHGTNTSAEMFDLLHGLMHCKRQGWLPLIVEVDVELLVNWYRCKHTCPAKYSATWKLLT
ncbi:hypothetical protein GIB67_016166 [Kingdonia uniflora]|uniref:Retrotransposon gag domain-containing protein n=1 Tax=Kingdonia uniflora TaxID=39325 RepID=A0A7J7N9L2_9MAGN|nr:hypothetical protein GIB67_016166 [Kingdonia uniflora]